MLENSAFASAEHIPRDRVMIDLCNITIKLHIVAFTKDVTTFRLIITLLNTGRIPAALCAVHGKLKATGQLERG
jgi:hypothetical protein